MEFKNLLSEEQIDNLISDNEPWSLSTKSLIASKKVLGKQYEIQIIVTRDEDDFMDEY
ncbi:hypothetical protein [Bizionia sp.]|uniref:hypothetical protein n=1 Tax=Bizionia sp. TaxID=1954480 RepID=UPI003A8D5765